MSRPYHKFFNVNEKPETQQGVIDFSQPHVVMEKLDGSMIRPIRDRFGTIRLATKMGLTDVAEQAEKIMDIDQWYWLEDRMIVGLTPILEYISPTNKIVVQYDAPKVVLTAIRNNVTGQYIKLPPRDITPFDLVDTHGSIADFGAHLRKTAADTGREGDIIRFHSGHMLKLKNEWYVQIHKTKDLVQSDRNIVELILTETIDDARSKLDETDQKRVDQIEANFWSAYENAIGRLEGLELLARTIYEGNKKRVALEMVPSLIQKQDGAFVFKALDGGNLRAALLEHCKKSIGSTPKYEELMAWMSA